MKSEIVSLRRLLLVSIYVLLIFSILAIIRSQNRSLLSRLSKDSNATTTSSVAGKHVVNAAG
jgi:hypothetical protein